MKKNLLKKIYNVISVTAISFLLLFFVFAASSLNSLPGNTLYPLKIASEQVVLFLSQVNTSWEMGVRLVVLNRRYHEALDLLEEKGSPRGYEQFANVADKTQKAVLGIKNAAVRKEYQQELTDDLRRYDAELQYLIRELEETPNDF